MTIKIESDALLCVLSRPPLSQQPCHLTTGSGDPLSSDGEELVDTSCPKETPVVFVPEGVDFAVDKWYSDDCTVTTASDSSSASSLDEKRVSFAEEIVSEVRTRPRTLRHEVSRLFYSYEETQRFRQEYRLERKLLSELDVDPETHPVDQGELTELLANSQSATSTGRHHISRVVVLHNDKLETFLNPQGTKQVPTDAFFDNDSFWSGSITWY